MKSPNFFSELKRRNVYRIAVAYVAAGSLLMQACSLLLVTTFQAPPWVMRIVFSLIALGFPVTLVLAWAFEITPEGIKWEKDVAQGKSIRHLTGRKLVGITVVLAALAMGLLVFQMLRHMSSTAEAVGGTVAVPPLVPEKSIAVLPFENLSEEKANAYFAEGIQDEILTRLSKIADLKVISRTSTQHYKSKPENLPEIARQLSVAHVLEGSVQKNGEAVRVNVQLIKAASDSHLWADTFDRKLSDIFSVESEVAKAIADQLRAKLTGREEQV